MLQFNLERFLRRIESSLTLIAQKNCGFIVAKWYNGQYLYPRNLTEKELRRNIFVLEPKTSSSKNNL